MHFKNETVKFVFPLKRYAQKQYVKSKIKLSGDTGGGKIMETPYIHKE